MRYFIFIFLFFLLTNCEEIPSSSNNEDPPIHTTIVSGQVILENQDEHSNCAIFDSALTMLTGSDSSGNYSLDFKDYYPDFTGSVMLIYYLYDYSLDTSIVVLNNGFVQPDTLSVNELGEIDPIFINQFIRLEAWTSDSFVVVGDSISFTARFTNLTDDQIKLNFPRAPYGGISRVIITQSPFQYWFGFEDDINESDFEVVLLPGESFEGTKSQEFPSGIFIAGIFYPIPSGPNVIFLLFENRERNSAYDDPIQSFLRSYWGPHHRGKIPVCPLPQKYELPRIEVEN